MVILKYIGQSFSKKVKEQGIREQVQALCIANSPNQFPGNLFSTLN